MPSVVLHGGVTSRRARLEQLCLTQLQVRGADYALMRGPYLVSWWRSSFESREERFEQIVLDRDVPEISTSLLLFTLCQAKSLVKLGWSAAYS